MGIYAMTKCLQVFFLGLTGFFDYTHGLAGHPVQDDSRMERGEIIDNVPSRPLDAKPLHS